MAIDRAETLKKAEKLLRQGKLALAIAEYARIVEEQPRDWNTRNTLGDLYVRAGAADKAAAQYEQIAEHLNTEGFFPKAAALYKKILKIKPDDEAVQLTLGEISATQGLLADAKKYFVGVAAKRRTRGDALGADEIVVRLGSLDPGDYEARRLAARTLEQNGDPMAAAKFYRSMHADLEEKDRKDEALDALREAVRLNPEDVEGRSLLVREAVAGGDAAGAKTYLDRATAGEDPQLLIPLLEIELRDGRFDTAREVLGQLLKVDPNGPARIVELAWTFGPSSPQSAFVCIDTVVDAALAAGNYMDAAATLQEFVTRVSGQIDALQKLVEICVDGGLEAIMYEAQAHLADAYLERGDGTEARVIAEDLVAREPWEPAHIERFRRALQILAVPDPDAVIADRLSGQGPFMATDPFMDFDTPGPAEIAVQPAAAPAVPEPPQPAPPPAIPAPIPLRSESAVPAPIPVREPDPPVPATIPLRQPEPDIPLKPRAAEPDIPLKPRAAEPDIPLRPRAAEPDIPLRPRAAEPDIPLRPRTPEVKKPDASPATETPASSGSKDLDAVFDEFRTELSRQAETSAASEHLTLAKTYLDMGMTDQAIGPLLTAARSPVHRFEAAAKLGRLYLKRNDLPHAVEWLERAAEAPAPSVNEARDLLYDLGSTLETAGEVSRALAVFLELQADAGEYRDVAARVEKLTRVQAGG